MASPLPGTPAYDEWRAKLSAHARERWADPEWRAGAGARAVATQRHGRPPKVKPDPKPSPAPAVEPPVSDPPPNRPPWYARTLADVMGRK